MRRREDVARDDDEGHLQRERDQIPEAAAPGVERLSKRGRRNRERRDEDDDRRDEREYERVGDPPFAPRGQAKRELRDETVSVAVG